MRTIERSTTRRVLAAALVTVWLGGVGAHAGQTRNLGELKVVKRVGQSALLMANGQRVLVLQGTPYQIGYAHGQLVGTQVKSLITRVLAAARVAEKADGTLDDVLQRTDPYIPARYKEELAGLADGAGMDRRTVMLANVFPELFHCSGFAYFGKATADGQLIHGRILDYMTAIGLQNESMVMVIRPVGGHTIMIANYAGFVGCVTGMNDQQLSIGEMGMGGNGRWDGVPMTYLMRQVLEECSTLDQAIALMRRSSRTCENAYVIGDAKLPSAVGVHATHESLGVLQPGESHPLLSMPMADCVMISGPTRYEALVEKTKAAYGKITVDEAIEIVKCPVAMESNLHDAILQPKLGVMYLANALPTQTKNYQACYQPYYRYELGTIVAKMDELKASYSPEGKESIAVSSLASLTKSTSTQSASPTSQPAESMTSQWERADAAVAKTQIEAATPIEVASSANVVSPTTITSVVPASTYRPIRSERDPKLATMLKRFDNKPEAFSYTMRPMMQNADVTMWSVTFPSPVVSGDAANDTVWCEYFRSDKPGPRPAVVVLHLLNNDFSMPRIIAQHMAMSGIDALMVKLPYYGERRSSKDGVRHTQMHQDLSVLLDGVPQAVCDVRRAMQFLSVQKDVDRSRIGLCGVSLGALLTTLTIGVDGNIPTATIIMGGVNLADIITNECRETNGMRAYLAEHKISKDQLKKMLAPIEPLNYLSRAQNTQVLMINAVQDHIIPPACTEILAQRLNRPRIECYEANHYTMTIYLLDAMQKVDRFFLTTPSTTQVERTKINAPAAM